MSSTEITEYEEPRNEIAPVQSSNFLQQVIAAASNPEVDAQKMKTMADLAIQLQTHEQEQEFNRDFNAALQKMPSISKKGAIKNKSGQVQSRYSKWEDIHAAIKPILEQHNLAMSFNVGHSGNFVTVQPVLSHVNGFVKTGEQMALPIDTTGSKNGTQGAGSAASYGKRHSAKAMLNIVEGGEDDDGRSAGGGPPLRPDQEQLIADARSAAMDGKDAYEQWFKGQGAAQRGWLVFQGHHDENLKLINQSN